MGKGVCVQMIFLNIYYNCIIILLIVTVCVCHDKGNVFCCTINFTSICILETSKNIGKGNKKHTCAKLLSIHHGNSSNR